MVEGYPMKKLLMLGVLPALFAMSEAKAAVISGVTVDTYSTQYIGGADQRLAFYTTDGSGVSGNTAINNPSGSMWLTNGSDPTPFITWNLGAAYNVASAKFWNYNEVGNVARGISTASVGVSLDGVTFTTLLNSISLNIGSGDAVSDITTLVGLGTTAQYIKLFNLVNFTENTDAYIGLSEVEFNSTPTTAAVPEPASMLLLGVGALGMMAFRRRSSAV